MPLSAKRRCLSETRAQMSVPASKPQQSSSAPIAVTTAKDPQSSARSPTGEKTIADIPPELLGRILSHFCPADRFPLAAVHPIFSDAVQSLSNLCRDTIDLLPTARLIDQPPSPPPLVYTTIAPLVRLAGPDLRVLRLHENVNSVATNDALLAAVHCTPHLQRLSLWDDDGAVLDKGMASAVCDRLIELKDVEIGDPGDDAVVAFVLRLPKQCELSLQFTKPSRIRALTEAIEFLAESGTKTCSRAKLRLHINNDWAGPPTRQNMAMLRDWLSKSAKSRMACFQEFVLHLENFLSSDMSFMEHHMYIHLKRSVYPPATKVTLQVNADSPVVLPAINSLMRSPFHTTLGIDELIRAAECGELAKMWLEISQATVLQIQGRFWAQYGAHLDFGQQESVVEALRMGCKNVAEIDVRFPIDLDSLYDRRPSLVCGIELVGQVLPAVRGVRTLTISREVVDHSTDENVRTVFTAIGATPELRTLHLIDPDLLFRQDVGSCAHSRRFLEGLPSFLELLGTQCSNLSTVFVEGGQVGLSKPVDMHRRSKALLKSSRAALAEFEKTHMGIDVSTMVARVEEWMKVDRKHPAMRRKKAGGQN